MFAPRTTRKGSIGQPSRGGRDPRTAGRGGVPLSREIRSHIEPRFGHSFGDIRVHADDTAAAGARELQARAYTFGQDIFFGAQQYAPATMEGRRLVAHELVHVVQQQRGGEAGAADRAPAAERQADDFADVIAGGGELTCPLERAALALPVGIARKPLPGQEGKSSQPEPEPVTRAEDIDLSTSYWEEELQKEQQSEGKYRAKSLVEQGWELVREKGEPVFKDDPREENKHVGLGGYLFSVKIRHGALKKEAWFAFYGDTGLAPEPEEEKPGLLTRAWRFTHKALDWGSLICKQCLLGSAIMSAAEGDFKGAILRVGLHRIGTGRAAEEGAAATAGADVSRMERFARRVGMNASSATSRQVLTNLDMKVADFIGKYRAGSILSQFPGEFLGETMQNALLKGGSTVRKLLTDGRFVK